jgi:hypothetical protein
MHEETKSSKMFQQYTRHFLYLSACSVEEVSSIINKKCLVKLKRNLRVDGGGRKSLSEGSKWLSMHHVGCRSWQQHWHIFLGDQKVSFSPGFVVHGSNGNDIDASVIGLHQFPWQGTVGTHIGWHHEGVGQQVH